MSDSSDGSGGGLTSEVKRVLRGSVPEGVRRNLALKLMILLMLGTLFSGAVVAVSYVTINGQLTDQVEKQIRSDTAIQSTVYENWLSERWTKLNTLSDREELHHESPSVVHQWLVAEQTRVSDDVHALYVVNRSNGEVVASSKTRYRGIDLYERGLESEVAKRLLFTSRKPLDLGEASPEMTLVGIRDGERLLLEAVPRDTELVTSHSFENSSSGLYSLEGHRLLGSETESGIDLPDEPRGGVVVTDSGNYVNGVGVVAHDLLNAEPVESYDEATTVGAYVVTSTPKEEAYAISSRISSDLALAFGLTFFLLVGLAAFSMRSVTLSVNSLSKKASRISRGSFDTELETERVDEIGQLYRSVGDMRDSLHDRIEEAERRKREVEEREEKYRSLFEDSRDALMLLDKEGFIDCNQETLELFGVDSVDSFVEYAPWELSPPEQPDGRDSKGAARRHVEKAFREGQDFFEWRHRAVDGREFPAEIKLSRFEHEGEPTLLALVRDISERKEYEEALQRAREELRQVIDLVPDPIFVKDREGRYLLANESVARAYGTTPGELEGAREIEVIPSEEDSEEFREEDLAVIESGEPRTVTEELTTAEGERRIYQTTRIPFESIEAADTVVLGYARDITELKEFEGKLETQRDTLKILNQVVRHDIRNDLQLILAYAGTLEPQVEEEDEEYVEQVLETAEEAVDLTTTAREVTEALLETEAELKPVPLRAVLGGEVEDVEGRLDDASIYLDGGVPEVEVWADDMLESVFRNLLKNAVIHNDKDTTEVVISAEEREGDVVVSVADNGPGIPDEQNEDIFEEGVQGLEESEGTGLGLYLVRTLVNRYGGEVWVEDNEPEGSVFRVRLRRAESPG